MNSLFDLDEPDVDEDARQEAREQRERRARMNHWCSECRGHRGGPCSFPDDEENRDE